MRLSTVITSLALTLLLGIPGEAFADSEDTDSKPQTEVVRLSKGSLTKVVPPGEYVVRLIDLVPGKNYVINRSTIQVNTPPKALVDPERIFAPDETTRSRFEKICRDYNDKLEKPPQKEKDIPEWLGELEKLAQECPTAEFDAALKLTERELEPVTVTEYEGFRVEVARRAGDPPEEWTFEFVPRKRNWLVSYGLQFLPDEDESFFLASAEPDDDGNAQFEVVRERGDAKDLEPDGVVMLSYLFDPWGSSFRPGISVGLGLSENELAAFLGGTFSLGEFAFVSAGIAVHPQQRLTGSLEEGQVISTNLSSEQLHTETYAANWFVGLTLRFDRNPRKVRQKKNAPQPTEEAPEEEEKEAEGEEPEESDDSESSNEQEGNGESSQEETG